MATPTPPLLSVPDPVALYGSPYASPVADDVPAWQPNTKYPAGFVVQQAGALYSATVQFTSGAAFNAANWTAIGGAGIIDGGTP